MCNNNVKAIMKKIYSFLFAATALFAAASCQKEVAPEVETPNYEKITFTASTEVETKTALHQDDKGKTTIWVAGDKISVFDADKTGNNRCFKIAELSEDARTATFSYTGEFVMDNTQPDPTVVALYPYQKDAFCNFFISNVNDITGLYFPSQQIAEANSFDSNAAFALGLGTMSNKELGFQNLYALLKFTVRDAGVKKVTVKVNEGAYIAGDAKIQMTLNTNLINNKEGKPVFESPVLSIVENGTNVINLTCEEGFNTEATYYVAVVPTTYTSISVALDGTVVKQTELNEAKNLEANKIYNLKDLALPKSERGLAFAKAECTVTLGDDFDAPQLSGVTEGVKYVSSNTDVAEVDALGNVKVKAVGETIITASAEESRYYLADEASYKITVTPNKVRVYVNCSKLSKANIYAWDANETKLAGAWPGSAMTWDEVKKQYYYDFDVDLLGQELNYIINNGDGKSQTGDLKITLSDYVNTTGNIKVLYLKPNSDWKQANARFAAYFFGNGDKWVNMVSFGSDDLYEVIVDSKYTKIIFCRMNPSTTANNWDNKWNQTGDLTIPTDGNNLFTISGWGNGSWGTQSF